MVGMLTPWHTVQIRAFPLKLVYQHSTASSQLPLPAFNAPSLGSEAFLKAHLTDSQGGGQYFSPCPAHASGGGSRLLAWRKLAQADVQRGQGPATEESVNSKETRL